MPHTISHAVSSIYPSLHLLRQDRLLAEQGREIALYFDTIDIEIAMIGFHEYLITKGRRNSLKRPAFRQDRALVNCLQASGWLGPFFLLPPHLAEFVRHLDDGRAFPRSGRRDQQLDEFLRLLGFRSAKHPSIRGATGEELHGFVRKQAATADQAFKAVQCIIYRPEERLAQWNRFNLLRACPVSFDYVRLTRSERFRRLQERFEANRPGLFYNNFADAVALAMLAELGEKANLKNGGVVPRFFDSGGLFEKIAKESGIEDSLMIRLDGGLASPVLVNATYLIHKATFTSPAVREGEALAAVNSEELLSVLEQIVRAPAVAREDFAISEADLDLELLDRLEISGLPLRQVVNDLAELSFLKNVWLEQLARKELAEFAQRFNRENLDSKKFRLGVNEAVLETKRRLEDKAQVYEKMYAIWHELLIGIHWLRRVMARRRRRPLDVIRDLELLRFSFSVEIKGKIEGIMQQLLSASVKGKDLTRLEQWSEAVDAYFTSSEESKFRVEDAEVASAILWSMKRYESIVELLEPFVSGDSQLPISLLLAAACFRSRQKEQTGTRILERLWEKMASSKARIETLPLTELQEASDVAVGTGYLFFHLWHSRNYSVEWREGRDGNKRQMDKEGEQLLYRAAVSARFAIRAIGLLEKRLGGEVNREIQQKKVYAVNQRLYYLTELGPSESGLEEEMRSAAAALATYKDSAEDLWQPTFHDTLARLGIFIGSGPRLSFA